MYNNEIVYELLERIKDKPAVYIGQKSVTELATFIVAYALGVSDMTGIKFDFFFKFQQFVDKKYNDDTQHHWSKKISYHHYTETGAFKAFYELLEEFKKSESVVNDTD